MRSEPVLPVRKRVQNIRHRSTLGAEPGTLVSHSDAQKMQINIVAYDKNNLVNETVATPEEIKPYLKKYPLTWIQITGLSDVDALHEITTMFKLNALAMEDVVNVHQRSKLEEYEQTYFAISRVPQMVDDQLVLQQLSIFWDTKFVITFLERPCNCFAPLFYRIQHGGKRERLLRASYLAYSILDTVVDCYFPILDEYGVALDTIEDNAIDNPSSWVIRHIHDLKHDLSAIRRAIWSQRDAIGSFKAIVESDKDLWFYLRDCEDHTIQLLDIIESYRDRSSGLMDIYLASVNNRTNRIMKQLTMIATFCMPISMFAGIYGMNFDRRYPLNMPELGWPFGYIYFWCIVAIFAFGMIGWFYRKGWFKRGV